MLRERNPTVRAGTMFPDLTRTFLDADVLPAIARPCLAYREGLA
ncbi:hypothetical protein [Phaeovulum vinaykumarii]|nr:hypothetical protein [Phaeovulum vinaykumarii]